MSNFEKQVKKQGEAFSIQPREQVWKRVEAELDKNKGRRVMGWWWLAPIALLLAGGSYYAVRQNNNTQQTTVQNTPQNAKTHPHPAISAAAAEKKPKTIKATDPKKTIAASDITTSNSAPQNELRSSGTKTSKHKNTLPPSRTNKTIHQSPVAASIAVTGAMEEANRTNSSNAGILQSGAMQQQPATTTGTITNTIAHNDELHTNSNVAGTAPDSTTASAIDTTSIPQPVHITMQDSATESTKNVSVGKPASKKTSWRLQLSGGLGNNVRIHTTSVKSDPLSLTSPQNPPFVNADFSDEANKAGASMGATVQRLQWLNKRIQWQAGFTFQYQSISQASGRKKDSAVYQQSNTAYRSNSFYYTGDDVKHTGTNLRILLSNDISFSLLKNRRLLLTGGFYTGFNLYNNYLVPDYDNARYVKASELYKKWFIGVDLGTEYNFKKGFGVGLTMQHDLTESYKPLGGDKKYWQSLLLKVNIPLKSK